MTDFQVQNIKVALFGDSGSGKTTFLSSYYGNLQSADFFKMHKYQLLIEGDPSLHNKLLGKFHCLEKGDFLEGEKTLELTSYTFSFIVGESQSPLKITFSDYKGGIWRESPATGAEEERQAKIFEELLSSQVGMLLLDATMLNDDRKMRHQLDVFRGRIKNIKAKLSECGKPVDDALPSKWIIALTKADTLQPSTTAEDIAADLYKKYGAELDELCSTLKINKPPTFLLLSSVQGDAECRKVIDAKKYMGLELIAPLAIKSSLEEAKDIFSRLPSGDRMLHWFFDKLPVVLDTLDALDDFLPPRLQVITKILRVLKAKDFAAGRAEIYAAKQAAATARGDTINAVLYAMQKELAEETSKRLYTVFPAIAD